MFFLGFFVGAAAAVWFVLHDGGEQLIRMGGRLHAAVRAFRDGHDREERFGA